MIRIRKYIFSFFLLFTSFVIPAQPVAKVKAWLAGDAGTPQSFSQLAFNAPLKSAEATEITSLLMAHASKISRSELQSQWCSKTIVHDEDTLRFEYKVFGDEPADGRSLFISMHGGGNAPANVNDQQWKNQIRLYTPREGVYLAPRAPSNTWNLWHESQIDTLFDNLIHAAILFENVNPNKVYLLGYSAGGDGVYQLAPRMADYFAAAAMMAGHLMTLLPWVCETLALPFIWEPLTVLMPETKWPGIGVHY